MSTLTAMDTGAALDVRDTASPEKLDGDLGRHLFDRSVNFLRRVCQPVCVDIDAYVAARTGHVLVRSQAPDRLSEVAPAAGALKPDLAWIHASHANAVGLNARSQYPQATPAYADVLDHQEGRPRILIFMADYGSAVHQILQ